MPAQRDIADVFRLTELQESMLVHRLRSTGADTGVQLVVADLVGGLDLGAFREVWSRVVERHDALRSSIHWRRVQHPVQVVARKVKVEIETVDASGLGAEERRALSEHERARLRDDGLDVTRAPAMRWRLLRLGAKRSQLIWVCHHLLVDGWSSALVLREVLDLYAEATTDRHRSEPASRRFGEYASWVRQRPAEPIEVDLQNLLATPLLVGDGWRGGATIDGVRRRRLGEVSPASATEGARRLQVAPSGVLLGCWGLTVAAALGGGRAVFGFTSSGRAIDFEGIESLVGMLANSLPLHVEIDRRATLTDWFRSLYRAQQHMQRHDHCSIAQLLRAGGVAVRRPPFDTLVAYASFPSGDASPVDGSRRRAGSLELEGFHSDLTTGYPLTVAVVPGPELRVEARYDRSRFADAEVDAWLDHFVALVRTTLLDPPATATVGWLLDRTADQVRRVSSGAASHGRGQPVSTPTATSADAPPVAATTSAEAQLTRIWNDLIEVQEFGIDDNFFALGGHSLLVPQLIERVLQDFGVELPLGAILEAPTVRRLAARLEEAAPEPGWACLVPVRGDGSRRPLYLVHGLGGEVGWFYNLANHLDPALPLYGLQAPERPSRDLSETARRYVSEVRQHQPHGPYRIGGYCVGGGIAFEMAHQLRAAGEPVELLVLIDSVPQAHAFGAAEALPKRVARRLRNLARKSPREIVASVHDAARQGTRRLTRSFSRTASSGSMELDDVLDMRTLPGVYHRPARRHFAAMRDYEPRPYDGDLWLFRTDDARFGEDFGWGELVVGSLHVERIDGRHADVMKEPHVRGLAAKLAVALAAGRGAM